MRTVLVTDHAWPDIEVERAILAGAGLQVADAPRPDEATLVDLARECEAIMTCFARVTPAVIESATRLKVVARYGVGVDNIAVDTATARNVPVTYVPDYCVAEVAEHALALLMALARGVVRYDRSVTRGGWDLGAGAPLRRIEGQTLGLIGCGRIGRSLARKAVGVGLRVLGYDMDPRAFENVDATLIVPTGLDDLLAQADFISLHLPLTPQTHAFIGESVLRKMKPTAYLINTARGGLIDTAALAQALLERRIAGAGIDVLPQEPPPLDEPLARLDNVIITPHVAFYSEESLQALRQRTAQSVVDVFDGRTPQNVWNRDLLTAPAAIR